MTDVAWITGGASGIGRALAQQLAQRRDTVIISGRNAGRLNETAATLASSTGNKNIFALECDVTEERAVAAAGEKIRGQWGDVTLLVNNAGVNTHHPFDKTPASEYEELFQINCLGAVRTIQQVLPAMRRKRQGAIVNVSSILGLMPSSDSPAYTVSKYAVAGLNEMLHQKLAGSGVHVVGVYPGYVKTAMTEPFVKRGSLKWRLGKTPEQMAAAILKAVRRKRRNVFFPWYVSWAVALHRWFPNMADRLSVAIRARGEKIHS